MEESGIGNKHITIFSDKSWRQLMLSHTNNNIIFIYLISFTIIVVRYLYLTLLRLSNERMWGLKCIDLWNLSAAFGDTFLRRPAGSPHVAAVTCCSLRPPHRDHWHHGFANHSQHSSELKLRKERENDFSRLEFKFRILGTK